AVAPAAQQAIVGDVSPVGALRRRRRQEECEQPERDDHGSRGYAHTSLHWVFTTVQSPVTEARPWGTRGSSQDVVGLLTSSAVRVRAIRSLSGKPGDRAESAFLVDHLRADRFARRVSLLATVGADGVVAVANRRTEPDSPSAAGRGGRPSGASACPFSSVQAGMKGLAEGVVRRNPTYRTASRPSRRNVGGRRDEAAAPVSGPCPPPRTELLQLHRDRRPLPADPHEE